MEACAFIMLNTVNTQNSHADSLVEFNLQAVAMNKLSQYIAPDKAAYCVFTQFRECENAIKFISVRTKTQ